MSPPAARKRLHPAPWAVCLLALGVLLPSLAASAVVRDVRIARHEDFVRCVVELDAPPAFRHLNASASGGPITIEFTNVTSAATQINAASDTGFVRAARTNHDPAKSNFKLMVNADRPVRVESSTIKNPWRAVVDLYEAGAPPPPLASAPTVPLAAPPAEAARALRGYRPRIIVIDPGHGGHHRGGNIRLKNGRTLDEATLTMPLARMIEALLAQDPLFQPRLTRTADVYVGLRERTRRAEEFNGNLFVSLHYNAVPSGTNAYKARGLEIYTWSYRENDTAAGKYLQSLDNEEGASLDYSTKRYDERQMLDRLMVDALAEQATESRKFASHLHGAMLRDSYFRSYDRGVKSARFKVLENYNMPSVLVEVGFVSHPEEAALAADPAFQAKTARLIYNGIVEYYEASDPGFRAARGRLLASR